MDGPTYQPMFEFRFISLPPGSDLARRPGEQATLAMTNGIELLKNICHDLTQASKAGRLGPILKVEGGIIIGELAGYVAVGPDTGGIVAAPGILKPV